MAIWPNFRARSSGTSSRSATYFTVSLLFWYMGLIPDLATLRDRVADQVRAQRIYGFLALGWRGCNRHWRNYERAYLILAGISTPLVLSRAQRRVVRLRDVGHPRLAHDDLPAVLRRRRHLLRLRDGR